MPRRGDADPLLLQAVSERLARLLAETPARRAEDDAADGSAVSHPAVTAPAVLPDTSPVAGSDTELVDVGDVPPPRRFGRLHLGVVCVLLLAGLLWAGWSMVRARPVAIASPVTVPVSAPPRSPQPSVAATPGSSSTPTGSSRTPVSAGSTPAGGPVVVHVLGAVRRPGLVTLSGRTRVQDAVDAAGGFSRDADPGDLNLAQVLQDGQQVVIGTAARATGEVRGNGAASGGSAAGGSGDAKSGGVSADGGAVLDLNAATEKQLEELPGVGPVTAGKISAWRTEHGRFSRVEELQEVDGIGPKTFAEIAPHVHV